MTSLTFSDTDVVVGTSQVDIFKDHVDERRERISPFCEPTDLPWLVPLTATRGTPSGSGGDGGVARGAILVFFSLLVAFFPPTK